MTCIQSCRIWHGGESHHGYENQSIEFVELLCTWRPHPASCGFGPHNALLLASKEASYYNHIIAIRTTATASEGVYDLLLCVWVTLWLLVCVYRCNTLIAWVMWNASMGDPGVDSWLTSTTEAAAAAAVTATVSPMLVCRWRRRSGRMDAIDVRQQKSRTTRSKKKKKKQRNNDEVEEEEAQASKFETEYANNWGSDTGLQWWWSENECIAGDGLSECCESLFEFIRSQRTNTMEMRECNMASLRWHKMQRTTSTAYVHMYMIAYMRWHETTDRHNRSCKQENRILMDTKNAKVFILVYTYMQ